MEFGFWSALYIFAPTALLASELLPPGPALRHTPLMSGSNFIHGVVVVGAMVVLGHAETGLEKLIGFLGVILGAANAAGGYAVTVRMLEMFERKPGQGGGR